MKIIIISVVTLLFVGFVIRLYIDNEKPEVSEFEVNSSKIPKSFDGYRILHLSDLHSKRFGIDGKKLIPMIDEAKPDAIFITGDMVSANQNNYTTFFELVDLIASKYKIYYVFGNHEESLPIKYQNIITDYLKEKNVIIINNKDISLEKDGEFINIYGVSFDDEIKKNFNNEKMINLLGTSNNSTYNILLAHNPNFIDVYSNWGADLVLSGHIHGGMVRLPIIGPIFSPDTFLFPKYSKGVYESGDSELIVSRGLGRGTKGFRLFNRPELVVITLKSEEKGVD